MDAVRCTMVTAIACLLQTVALTDTNIGSTYKGESVDVASCTAAMSVTADAAACRLYNNFYQKIIFNKGTAKPSATGLPTLLSFPGHSVF